jgi:hypothetical protein
MLAIHNNNTYKNKRITSRRINTIRPVFVRLNNQRNTRKNINYLNTTANLVNIRKMPEIQQSDVQFVKLQAPLYANKMNLTRKRNNGVRIKSLKRQNGYRNLKNENTN